MTSAIARVVRAGSINLANAEKPEINCLGVHIGVTFLLEHSFEAHFFLRAKKKQITGDSVSRNSIQ
jgi:hypothetical protein